MLIGNVTPSVAGVYRLIVTDPNGTVISRFNGQPVLYGNNFILSWRGGTLLQAMNLAGPWMPTGATSPYTNDVTPAPRKFFRLSNP